jgi:DNA-binding CsgD family transcriptional regulator
MKDERKQDETFVAHLIIACYLVVLIAGAAAIAYVTLMARVHSFPFLKPFAFFLAFANLSALANLTSAYASANLLSFTAQYENTVYAKVLGSASRLSQVGIAYVLLAIAYGFGGRRPSRSINVTFGLIAALLLVSYIITGILPDGSTPGLWIGRGQVAVFYLAPLAIVGSLIGLIIGSQRIQSVAQRKAVRVFAISYLSVYAVFVFTRLLPMELRFPPNALALLLINLVPFLWLGKLFPDAYLATPPSAEDCESFDRFCRNHGLTSREADVLKLILQGRSNADIGKELFISFHTVKNHITNIYGKLGVRSRWQLISLFHSDQQKRFSAERLSS